MFKYADKKLKAKYYSMGPYQGSLIVLNQERERRPSCLSSFPAGIVDLILSPSSLNGSGACNQTVYSGALSGLGGDS